MLATMGSVLCSLSSTLGVKPSHSLLPDRRAFLSTYDKLSASLPLTTVWLDPFRMTRIVVIVRVGLVRAASLFLSSRLRRLCGQFVGPLLVLQPDWLDNYTIASPVPKVGFQ